MKDFWVKGGTGKTSFSGQPSHVWSRLEFRFLTLMISFSEWRFKADSGKLILRPRKLFLYFLNSFWYSYDFSYFFDTLMTQLLIDRWRYFGEFTFRNFYQKGHKSILAEEFIKMSQKWHHNDISQKVAMSCQKFPVMW